MLKRVMRDEIRCALYVFLHATVARVVQRS